MPAADPADRSDRPYARRMDPAELLALRSDERAAVVLIGLRGDW